MFLANGGSFGEFERDDGGSEPWLDVEAKTLTFFDGHGLAVEVEVKPGHGDISGTVPLGAIRHSVRIGDCELVCGQDVWTADKARWSRPPWGARVPLAEVRAKLAAIAKRAWTISVDAGLLSRALAPLGRGAKITIDLDDPKSPIVVTGMRGTAVVMPLVGVRQETPSEAPPCPLAVGPMSDPELDSLRKCLDDHETIPRVRSWVARLLAEVDRPRAARADDDQAETLRDRFAAAALAFLADPNSESLDPAHRATYAYEMADAMLAARKETPNAR